MTPARTRWPKARHDRRRMVAPGELIGQHHHLAPGFAVHHPGTATQPVGQALDDIA